MQGCYRLLMVKAPWLGALVDQGSKFLRSSDPPIILSLFDPVEARRVPTCSGVVPVTPVGGAVGP